MHSEASISHPPSNVSIQPNTLGVVASLSAWFGAQLIAVGTFDGIFVGSHTGERFVWLGTAICVIGSFVLGMQKLKRPIGAAKLWLLCFGMMPITMFILFLGWRITLAMEHRTLCDAGEAVACRTVGEARAKKGKTADAISLFERGCALDDARSCRELGGQARIAPERVSKTALDYYLRACELDDGLGCDRAAHLLRETDPARANELFERACALEYIGACSAAY